MSATYGQVRQWSSAALDGAVDEVINTLDTFERAADDLIAARRTTWDGTTSWVGAASEAAREKQRRLEANAEEIAGEMRKARKALDTAARGTVRVEHAVAEADGYASRNSLRIGEDGTVTDVEPAQTFETPDEAEAYTRDRQRRVDEAVTHVEKALRLATQVDDELHAAMTGIMPWPETSPTNPLTSTINRPPAGATPQETSDWWRTLTRAEQQHLVDADPDLIAGLYGIPGWATDEANQARLPIEKARLERELDEALNDPLQHAPGYGGNAERLPNVIELRAKLASLDAVETMLDKGGDDPRNQRRLLLLDVDNARVEAAVATGNVDTADRVRVSVPGMNSTVDGNMTTYETNSVARLREAREQLAFQEIDQELASISYFGYQSPQKGLDGVAMEDTTVLRDTAARRGASEFGDFLRTLSASREIPPDVTVDAYSYGAILSTYSLREDIGVDTLIITGAPRMPFDELSDLHVSGEVYNIETTSDPWANWPMITSSDPGTVDGIIQRHAEAGVTPDGTPTAGSHGHGEFDMPGTSSFHDKAAIDAGLTEYFVKYPDGLPPNPRQRYYPDVMDLNE